MRKRFELQTANKFQCQKKSHVSVIFKLQSLTLIVRYANNDMYHLEGKRSRER